MSSSSYYHHSERREQRFVQNPAPSLTAFSPAIYRGPLFDDVGNGQQSSYSVRYYTYPTYMSYYEIIG